MNLLPLRSVVLLTAAWLACAACKKPGASNAAPHQDAGTAAPAPAELSEAAQLAQEQRDARRRFRDAMVFVDGRPMGALLFQELPPDIKPTLVSYGPVKKVLRFTLYDYVEALGVDMGRLKEVHIQGGRGRVGVIPRQVLVDHRDLRLQFTQQTGGKPRMDWPDVEIGPVVRLDIVTGMAIYVETTPPMLTDNGSYQLADGGISHTFPAEGQQDVGGARIYLDGRLVTFLKRNQADNRDQAQPLGPALTAVGVPLDSIQRVELLDRDTLMLALPAGELGAGHLSYSFPARHQGRMRVHVASGNGAAAEHMAAVIRLWTTPTARKVAIPDAYFAQFDRGDAGAAAPTQPASPQ